MSETRGHGEDSNSLAASPDPEVQRKIREGRKKAREDEAAMLHWKKSGFTSGSSTSEKGDS